jgi:hypothetical protein
MESSSQKSQIETDPTTIPSTSKSNDVSFKSRSSSTSSTNSSQTITILQQQQQQQQPTNETANEQQNIEVKPVVKQPHNTIFKESELQVKIADLGNACWNVIVFFLIIQHKTNLKNYRFFIKSASSFYRRHSNKAISFFRSNYRRWL